MQYQEGNTGIKMSYGMPVPKPFKPWRSRKYRDLVVTKPCLRCGRYGHTVPHHCRDLVECGGSEKPGDQWIISLCSVPGPGEQMSCHDIEQQYIEVIPVPVKLRAISDMLNEFLADRLPKG